MSLGVADWLRDLGLEQYAPAFRENAIEADLLPSLTAEDLRDIGVTLVGHRRRLLDAIAGLKVDAGTGSNRNPGGAQGEVSAAAMSGPSTSAERRQLTVLFCDLVGSTALASRLDPEDLREVIGAYHRVAAEVIEAFGGFVAKYMGDGVLAYFGYPQAHEHDSEQAVRAGLALIERVAGLRQGEAALASRVGIGTGLVVVGDLIGSGEARERGVVGETPNLAARLQEKAAPSTVLIAESTRRLVGDLFDYLDIGPLAIKGLAAPVMASQVLRETRVDDRFKALRSPQMSPLIGREDELQLLLRRWELAKSGEGQIVLISGEPGIGKSRLTVALEERLESERSIRLRHFCSPHRRDSALSPIIARLERAADFAPEDTPEIKLDKLVALLSRSGERDRTAEAVFADLLALPLGERYPPLTGDPRQKRELILATLLRQLEALAKHRPVLFLFEDAHWIDSTSLDLLDRIAERIRRLPALMVVTFRPEFEPPWTGQAQVTSVTLSRLGKRETMALVKRVAGGLALPAEIAERIVERTDGIPLCIEELTRTLLEGDVLREVNGRYIVSGAAPALAIPASLHDSLMARLDRLGPAKEVAQIGAAVGREFSLEMLRAVAAHPEDRLREALKQLVEAGLIFPRGGSAESFVFKHALVQDAAYATLLRGRRQELHTHIAKALEKQIAPRASGSPLVGEGAALLAYHWLRAEEWEKALASTLQAAERAARLFARSEAINHYWQALEVIQRLPPLPERVPLRCNIIMSLFALPGWTNDEGAETRLLHHVDQALVNAAEAGDMADVARLEAIKGRHQLDDVLARRAIERAQASGDQLAEAFTRSTCGAVLAICGQYEASLDYVGQAIDIRGARGLRRLQAYSMASNGRCFSARAGKLDLSLDFTRRVREAAEALDDRQLRAWDAMEAEPNNYLGLWTESVRAAEAGLPIAWEIGEWDVVFFATAWLAGAYLKLGLQDKARLVVDRAFNEVPARVYQGHASLCTKIARAQIHLAAAQHSEALIVARQSLAAAQAGGFRVEEVWAYRLLGQIHEAAGERADADHAFRRSLDLVGKIQCPPELAQSLLAYGRFRRGDNSQADHTLIEQALRLFEDMKATGWIEEARAALTSH